MDHPGLPQPEDLSISSERLSEFSTSPIDDIPEAVRDIEQQVQTRQKRKNLVLSLGLIGSIVLLAVPFLWFWAQSSTTADTGTDAVARNADTTESSTLNAETAPADPSLLGHLPYEEAPAEELQAITDDGSILLRQAAAEQFVQMMDAAKADGVNLVPLSGFRSQTEQETVFFEVKAERGQEATTRAEVSAPPGYSEHHTGYAIDIGDSYYPDTDLKTSFEKTPAFEWLQENAAYYSFELSFPPNNSQGVSYEPWHWRFVGDRDSLETFYRARSANSAATRSTESSDTTSTANP